MITYNNCKTESEWNCAFCEALTACNAEVFACAASRMQTPGWPDRYVSHPLFVGWIECKRYNNTLSTKQEYILRRLNERQAGSGIVLWLDNVPLSPIYLHWYSPVKRDWLYQSVSGVSSAIDMLRVLHNIQTTEQREAKL